jgi:hypothetical protein
MEAISKLLDASGRKAEYIQRRYDGFQSEHPHLTQIGSLGRSMVDTDRSTYKEFEKLMEPGVEGFEDLVYALDPEYNENDLDKLED